MKQLSENPLISIIVPVYNVAPYLEHCIEGITGQTYKNLEIILVDDGSTDGSADICDSRAEKDGRIRVLHTDNGGQSRARNRGLEIAGGELIGFVDGDDSPHPEMYDRLLSFMRKEDLDIAECNFDGRRSDPQFLPEEGKYHVTTGREALKLQLERSSISSYPSTSVWSKLFRREAVQGLKFPEGRIHEEFAYLAEAFLRSGRYGYLNGKLYERILRGDSTTAAKFSMRAWDKYEVYKLREEVIRQYAGDDQELVKAAHAASAGLKRYLLKQTVIYRLRGSH